MQPQDVIKSQIQTDSHFNSRYSGMFDCARKLWAAEGWRGFTRGAAPCFARSVPANAVAFLTFEMVQKRLLPVVTTQ